MSSCCNYEVIGTGSADPNEKPEKLEGMVEHRSTTDILMLLLIICMWIAMTIVGAKAIQSGDPYKLLAPLDDQARACGYTQAVADQKKFYYVMTSGVGVCVNSCPGTTSKLNSTNPDDYTCVSSFETSLFTPSLTKSNYIANYCMDANKNFDITKSCGCNLRYKTVSVFNRCIFTDKSVLNQFASSYSKYQTTYFTEFIQDIYSSITLVFTFGLLVSFGLCFLWCTLMRIRWLGFFVTWSCILSVLVVFVILIGLAQTTATKWANEDPVTHTFRDVMSLKIVSIILFILSVLYVCLMIFMRKNINLAITTVSQAARCIESMPLIVLCPIIQMIGFLLFLAPWTTYIFYQASCGEMTTSYGTLMGQPYPISKKYTISNDVEDRLWFLFFCLLWTMNFCASIGSLVVGICVSKWYFTKEEEKSAVGSSVVPFSYAIALRYHLGTVAFGSLIIAIIQFARAIVLYIEKFNDPEKQSCFVKYLFKCVVRIHS